MSQRRNWRSPFEKGSGVVRLPPSNTLEAAHQGNWRDGVRARHLSEQADDVRPVRSMDYLWNRLWHTRTIRVERPEGTVALPFGMRG